jgi:glycerophosphoryl diester phosphodiesterase
VLAPSVPVGLLGTPARGRLSALATWADQINPRYWSADASYVAAVHEHGMDCLVWTVNRASAMRRALQMGVDGIITDRPDRLHEVLDSWKPITRTAGRGGGIRTRG